LSGRSTLWRKDYGVSVLVRSATGVLAVAAASALLPATEAYADCQPNPAVSGQTVVCSGNAPNGFQADPGVDNLIVRTGPNATVHDNGSVAISVNDFSRVNNQGTISNHPGNFGVTGIFAGNNNTILNPGEIKLGLGGTGISVGDNNTIRSSGDITVGQSGTAIVGGNANTVTITSTGTLNLGASGIGIEMFGDGGMVTNNGSITGAASTTGIESFGFGATVINNGTITLGKTTGSQTFGVLLNSASTFTNNNTITVGTSANGVVAEGFFNTVTNNGTITAGANGVGVWTGAAGGENTVTNNVGATISTSGHFGDAVLMQNGGFLFNAGTISNPTAGGVAIDFCSCSTGYTLMIAPTSVITGLVTATGNDTFELGGTGNGTFALNSIGPTKQYEGFGVFNVISGFWSVSKVFGQSQAWNVDGGTLSGNGTLGDLFVNNGGTLQPGTGTPGTSLKVNGNLAFESGALYVLTLNATTSTLTKVSGNASLAGTVSAIVLPGTTNHTYTILQSGGLLGTTFNGFSAPGFAGTLTYTPDDVLLSLTASLGAGGNLNVNQQNAATALNNAFNSGGTLPSNLLSIFNLTGSNLANALTQLDGEAGVDGQAATFQQMTQFLSLMLDPFVGGRNGVGGGSGGALGFAPEQEEYFPSDIALAYDAILKAPPKPMNPDRPWSVWGTAYGGGDKTNGDPTIGSTTFTANTFGFAAGLDYHAAPDSVLGFALAGGGTNWNLAQALGGGRSDAFQAGIYGTKYFGPAYVAGSAALANNWMTTNRFALGDQLTANFNAQSFGGRLEAGYRYAAMPTTGVTPYGAVQAVAVHTPAYSETDLTGGGFGLTYAAANATDTRSELGARFDSLVTMNGLPLILRARLAWAHDWVSNPALTAVFQALPGSSFVVNGAALPANSTLASFGGELKLSAKWSLLGKFDGQFASGSQTYGGTGTLRYTW
jgi:uncharacterized protein with beta-barrel porin domain